MFWVSQCRENWLINSALSEAIDIDPFRTSHSGYRPLSESIREMWWCGARSDAISIDVARNNNTTSQNKPLSEGRLMEWTVDIVCQYHTSVTSMSHFVVVFCPIIYLFWMIINYLFFLIMTDIEINGSINRQTLVYFTGYTWINWIQTYIRHYTNAVYHYCNYYYQILING